MYSVNSSSFEWQNESYEFSDMNEVHDPWNLKINIKSILRYLHVMFHCIMIPSLLNPFSNSLSLTQRVTSILFMNPTRIKSVISEIEWSWKVMSYRWTDNSVTGLGYCLMILRDSVFHALIAIQIDCTCLFVCQAVEMINKMFNAIKTRCLV